MQLTKGPNATLLNQRAKTSLFAISAANTGSRSNLSRKVAVSKQQGQMRSATKMSAVDVFYDSAPSDCNPDFVVNTCDFYDSAPSDCNHDIEFTESKFRVQGLNGGGQSQLQEPAQLPDFKKELTD